MRDVGMMGESTFESWCHSAGLIPNRSQVDRTGWDYFVEFPETASSGQPADLEPAPIECRVQVKSTDGRQRKRAVRLQNLERLVKTPIPTFICVLEFDGLDTAQRAYLVHVGEEIIRRVLTRLRELEQTEEAARNKRTVVIAYGESSRLPDTNGTSLKHAIEQYVAKGLHAYNQWKKNLLETLGYEDGHGYMRFQISGLDPIGDLIDLSLGLRKSLKIDRCAMYDTRFKVDCEVPLPNEEGAELSLSPTVEEGVISFREEKSSPAIHFPANVHNPSVNRVAPRDRMKFRIENQFFDIQVEPFAGRAQFSLSPDITKVRARLCDINAFLALMHMLRIAGPRGIWMDVTIHGKDFLPDGKILVNHLICEVDKELELAKQAMIVARAYNIEQEIWTTIEDVLRVRKEIQIFHNVLENRTEGSSAKFFVDGSFVQIKERSGAILWACFRLGDHILYCIIGLVGPLEEIGAKQYRLVSEGRCLHRLATAKENKPIKEEELAELVHSVEREMEAADIGPVLILEGLACEK